MGRLIFVQVSALMMLLFAAQGCATGERPATVTLSGTVRLVGNEPFARLVLATDERPGSVPGERDYLLVGPLTDELRRGYQLKRIRLEGFLCDSPSPEFSKCFEPSRILDNPLPRE